MKTEFAKLQTLLETEISAKEIARRLKVSIPTAYRRVRKLMEAGAQIKVRYRPHNKRGPTPTTYHLVKAIP